MEGMTTLTLRSELAKMRCEQCWEGGEIVLYRDCHPDYLTIPVYRQGELCLECSECGEIYLAVLVAG
jgi:uncharacterized protein with PIN domain